MATAEELAQELLGLNDSLHQLMARGRTHSVSLKRAQDQITARRDIVIRQLRELNPNHAVFGRQPSKAKARPYIPGRRRF